MKDFKFSTFSLFILYHMAFVFTLMHVEIDGLSFKYTGTSYDSCQVGENRFGVYLGYSTSDCEAECGLRSHCKESNFIYQMNVCELFSKSNRNTSKGGKCTHLKKSNIHNIKTKCGEQCTHRQVCDRVSGTCIYKECARVPKLANGTFLGNMKGISNVLRVKCNYGFGEKKGITTIECLDTGNWSRIPECVRVENLTCNDDKDCRILDRNSICDIGNSRFCKCATGYTIVDGVCTAIINGINCTENTSCSSLDPNSICDANSGNKGKCVCTADYTLRNGVCSERWTDCTDVLNKLTATDSGVYTIQPNDNMSLNVLCDMKTDGGGWTVIQSRPKVVNGTFNRTLTQYINGFGREEMKKSFWLGLENIYQINQLGRFELRIDIQNFTGANGTAIYENFKIEGSSNGYRLKLGTFSYDNSAGLVDPGNALSKHENNQFSTSNYHYDALSTSLYFCTKNAMGGWWHMHDYCDFADLNGQTKWHGFSGTKELNKTNMMIRKLKVFKDP